MADRCVVLRWGWDGVEGAIEVTNGVLGGLAIVDGRGRVEGRTFRLEGPSPGLRVEVSNAACREGAFATMITAWTGESAFSFFLRDVVNPACPIYIPELKCAVVPGNDTRTYDAISAAVAGRGLLSDFDRFDLQPEESYASAAAKNRQMPCPTWLGVPRDARFFRVAPRVGTPAADVRPQEGFWGIIERAVHSVRLPTLTFAIGRGDACRYAISRRLQAGALPIVHSEQREETMQYALTFFATLEDDPTLRDPVAGTDWQTAYAHMNGNMLTPERRNALRAEYHPPSELLLCCRIVARNPRETPNYAWFKAPHPAGRIQGYRSDCTEGLVREEAGAHEIIAAARLNGRPAPQAELAVLVQPGEEVRYDVVIPHRPVSAARAEAYLALSLDTTEQAVSAYWQARQRTGASIVVPEVPVQEHVNAGLLHLDLAAVGREPDEPVAATIGWYAPIGTESAPIIQYFDMMGWHDLARRAIEFFFKRQREDGFIQNFGGYESETGPLLWTVGEHLRYTQDWDWVRGKAPNIRRACDYLIDWRNKNKTAACRAAGAYGLVNGKVADPDDFLHQFFLNAGTYIGLKRSAEVLADIDSAYAERLAAEAREFRHDIRRAFRDTMAKAPVVPLADGTWAPLPPTWPDQRGATTLYAEGGNWFTHGTFAARSVLTGAMWLAFWGVLDPDELGTTFLLKVNQAPTTCDNAALSQPYYSRHDAVHLARGEVKPFLRAYYNQLTALADRETRTFWEHYSGHSQHKTHEEAWFLMQTRWALCREVGDSLCLFGGIPRAWLSPGSRVGMENACTYFGRITFLAETSDDGRGIEVRVTARDKRMPKTLRVRIPHPDQRSPVDVVGPGCYDRDTESIIVDPFRGKAVLTLTYPPS